MPNKIVFTSIDSTIDSAYTPIPARKNLPEWYKNTPSYIEGKKRPTPGGTTGTIKRCMPVFDSLTTGYVIPTYVDVYVECRKNSDGKKYPFFWWPSRNPIEFHDVEQAPNYPKRGEHFGYPKWKNPWSIKTPKGYSCLFTPPKHSDTNIFTIFEGIVDTDKYTAPVNFPFILNDITFEGLIPAGTPIVQIIPFKRESWKMELGREGELENVRNVFEKLHTYLFDKYKNLFWDKKEYH